MNGKIALENGIISTEVNDGKGFNPFKQKKSQRNYATFHEYLTDVKTEIDDDQPFYTFDLADVLWKAQLWKDRFPNIFPYYAVKANADPILVRLFVLLGYGFDCSTQGEIELVLKYKADPKKIIFAHTIKFPKALKYAASVGVDLLTFDSKEELIKIREHFPEARLILRLKSESKSSVYNLSKKFGCGAEEAKGLLQQAKDLSLNVVGVSFHVGALCDDPRTYTSTIEDSRRIFDLANQLGFHFTIMDIGAGFFGSTQREGFFYKLSEVINDSLENNFPEDDVKFIAEPGCYYVGSAVSLVTCVIGKKEIKGNSDQIQRHYYLNDGFYGSFFVHNDIYDVTPVPLLTSSELKRRPKYKSKIWGQTCCSEDIISEETTLPEMEAGEHIVWLNTGAYSRGICSNFTAVPSPASRYIFIKNDRLKEDKIPNLQEISDFISKTAVLVESST